MGREFSAVSGRVDGVIASYAEAQRPQLHVDERLPLQMVQPFNPQGGPGSCRFSEAVR